MFIDSNNTAVENNYTFLICPPVGRYILKMTDPVVRLVCKAWKTHFGKRYFNAWMEIENNKNESDFSIIKI